MDNPFDYQTTNNITLSQWNSDMYINVYNKYDRHINTSDNYVSILFLLDILVMTVYNGLPNYVEC